MRKVSFKIMDGGNKQMVQDIVDELNKIGKVTKVEDSSMGYGMFVFGATVIEFETDVEEEEYMKVIEEVMNRKYSE